MSSNKLVVLDTDVIIHFHKGGKLSQLHEIIHPHQFCILDEVFQEIRDPLLQQHVDNLLKFKFIVPEELKNHPKASLEAIKISANPTIDLGEAFCLAFAQHNSNIIASSNLRDIIDYCQKNNIEFLTTLDLIAIARKRKIFTKKECNNFVQEVIRKGSKIPNIEIDNYCNSGNLKMAILGF